jgi:hypothetical protein
MESDSFTGIDEGWCRENFEKGGYGAFGTSSGESQTQWMDVPGDVHKDLNSAATFVTRGLLNDKSDKECGELLRTIEASNGSIPSEFDRVLIAATAKAMGGIDLSPDQKRSIRSLFLDQLKS